MNRLMVSIATALFITLLNLFSPFEQGAMAQDVAGPAGADKVRIMVVSSYHREYLWSQNSNKGVVTALLEFNYLDEPSQGVTYTESDFVESSRAIVKKAWMDTKRKNSEQEMARALDRIVVEIDQFKPHLILLGDDNAGNYFGNHYMDGEIPVVFWGLNGTPFKYGLLDSIERPGHNITGVYQAGHHLRAIKYLQQLVPGIKRLAVLSDNSPSGRAHAKKVKSYGDEGLLPVELVEVVITNSFSEWKARVLALQDQVDAFFMAPHHTLRDDLNQPVESLDAAAWYLRNIRLPEIGPAKFLVQEGMLCAIDDSAYLQGYEATKMAHKILHEGALPADMKPFSPSTGPFLVNRQRAETLGLLDRLESQMDIIDEIIDMSKALE